MGTVGNPNQNYVGYLRNASLDHSIVLTANLHLAPRLKMRGAITPLPSTSLWRGA